MWHRMSRYIRPGIDRGPRELRGRMLPFAVGPEIALEIGIAQAIAVGDDIELASRSVVVAVIAPVESMEKDLLGIFLFLVPSFIEPFVHHRARIGVSAALAAARGETRMVRQAAYRASAGKTLLPAPGSGRGAVGRGAASVSMSRRERRYRPIPVGSGDPW